MKLRSLLAAALVMCAAAAGAQSWSEISTSGNYLWGEGMGDTPEAADQQALAMLIRQVKVNVSDRMSLRDEMKRQGRTANYEQTVSHLIDSYSAAALDNTKALNMGKEGNQYKIGRYIARSEVDKIFASRRKKVVDMVKAADRAEQQGKVDVALRNLSWAFSLLKSTPDANAQELSGRPLMTLIPERMEEILSNIKVSIDGHDGTEMDLLFNYKGKPVNSLDYRFNDGGFWSNLCGAQDGFARIDLSPGSPMDKITVEIECNYVEQADLDDEIRMVMASIEPVTLSRATINVTDRGSKTAPVDNALVNTGSMVIGGPAATASTAAPAVADPRNTFTEVDPEDFRLPDRLSDPGAYAGKMEELLKAVASKRHADVAALLTPDGQRMYNRLLKYGNATLINKENMTYWPTGDGRVICRGAMLNFRFRSGSKRNFSQELVIGFNAEGLIDNIAFGLGQTSTNDILGQSAYPEQIRQILLTFMENYQTAFALKDLGYLKSIFADGAIIITGTVKPGVKAKDRLNIGGEHIVYNRLNKQEYMDRLERTFASREYVTLRFNNARVRRANSGGEIYGIQLEQDYFSPSYCDHGYLFLELNLNDIKEPQIIVRTWQPKPDPKFGLFNENDFPIQQYDD